MAKEHNVSGSLRFLSLLMVVSNVVIIGGWLSLAKFANVLSDSIIDKVGLLEGINIEVTDWVNWFLWKLSLSGVSPVIFNTRSVPLVNDGNDLLAWSSVDLVEQINVFMVNEDLLLEGSVFFKEFNEPSDFIFIKDFGKDFSSGNIEHSEGVLVFSFPSLIVETEEESIDKRKDIESLFSLQGIKSSGVDLLSSENDFTIRFQGFFDGVFHFETWSEWVEISWEPKHLHKGEQEGIESCFEDQASWVIFDIPFLSLSEGGVVEVKFLLGSNALEIFHSVPPKFICLDEKGIRLLSSHYISSSFCQQGGGVGCSDKVQFSVVSWVLEDGQSIFERSGSVADSLPDIRGVIWVPHEPVNGSSDH